MVKTNKIPNSKLNKKTTHEDGDTQDIINSILRMDTKTGSEFCNFSRQFEGKDGLKKLWRFVRDGILYKKDKKGEQVVKSPAALYKLRSGDCKSKTLFINAVLRCLNIPYIIRFTNYQTSDRDIKHVYTVAIINGKQLPIDSVYYKFGEERQFNIKIDHKPSMTKIIEITGLNFDTAKTTRPIFKKSNCDLPRPSLTNENIEHLAELKEKQAQIPKQAPIEFHKISEGLASLQLAKQELEFMKIMQPQCTKVANVGLNMISKAMTGNINGALCGIIPPQLKGLYNKIKLCPQLTMAANSFGIGEKRIQQLLKKTQNDAYQTNRPKIGNLSFPQRYCLNGLWFVESAPYTYGQLGTFEGWDPGNMGRCGATSPVELGQPNPPPGWPSVWPIPLFYGYGRMSEYRVTAQDYAAYFDNQLTNMTGSLILDRGGNGSGPMSFWINSQADFNAMLEILNSKSGVLTNYINDIFDPTNSAGTMGSGMFYTFADSITYNGQTVLINDLPSSVTIKRGFQAQFMGSCNLFSGVSPASLRALNRNGVIHDSGKQPETTLNELFALYKTTQTVSGIHGHSIGEPITVIVAAIAAAVVAIVAAVAAAVDQGAKAEAQAPLIDNSAALTSNFTPLVPSTMPGNDDFVPLTTTFGTPPPGGTGGTNGGKNNLLLAGAAALAVMAFLPPKKNKK